MPDTRESGDGSGPPPAPALARQLDKWFSGAGIRWLSALLAAIAVSVVVWLPPPAQNAPLPATSPSPTEGEMERFCSRYEEVKDLSYSEMARALVDYAPDDIKHFLSGASEQPPRGFPSHQFFIDPYLGRCPR